jgi:hypothetical protein
MQPFTVGAAEGCEGDPSWFAAFGSSYNPYQFMHQRGAV